MNFNTIDSIRDNFCKDKELTLAIVGKLEGREVKVIATDSLIGRFFHKIRYFFSQDYHKKFDAAAREFLGDRQVVLRPKNEVSPFHKAMDWKYEPVTQLQEVAPTTPPQTKNPLPEEIEPVVEEIKTAPAAPIQKKHPLPVEIEPVVQEIKTAPAAPIQKKHPLPQVMDPLFQEMSKALNPQAETLWRTLFTRFAEDRHYGESFLNSIQKNREGAWELTFPKPLKMHLVSTELVDGALVEDPPGGLVMIFGENGPLKITIRDGEMQFTGLQTYSKAPRGLGKLVGDPVEASLISFKPAPGDQFEIIVGKETLFKTIKKSNIKPFAKILENWGKNATILASNTEPASVILKK